MRELETFLLRAPSGVLLFGGPETYLKEHYRAKIRKTYLSDGGDLFGNTVIEDGDLTRLAAEAEALPLFGGRKLVEFRGFNYNKAGEAELNALDDALVGAEDVFVLLYADAEELDPGPNPKKPSVVFERMTKKYRTVYFEQQSREKLVSWVSKHFISEGIALSKELCAYLIDRCGTDMYNLAGEIEKLAAYSKANGKQPNEQMIELVCCESRTYGAFDFSNALLAGDKAAAYRIYRDMREKKTKSSEIIAAVGKTLNELLTIKVLAQAGYDKNEIAAKMHMHPYPVQIRLNAVRKYDRETLSGMFEKCVRADRTIKSGTLSEYHVVEKLILG